MAWRDLAPVACGWPGDTGGAGLGLAIASNIVVAHGGRIEAGQAPQGGLWVHIELPVQTS